MKVKDVMHRGVTWVEPAHSDPGGCANDARP